MRWTPTRAHSRRSKRRAHPGKADTLLGRMRVYLLGIAGTGMGSFAGLLRKAGHEVCGSDENVYPPMSDKLRDWGIQVFTPYAAANLEREKIDFAVVGNVIRAENVEAKAVRRR